MQQLCTIEDVFNISGRGCVIVPGIPYDFPIHVGIGSRISIVTPNGQLLETHINGVEMINRGRPMNHAPFCVPRTIAKNQLPIGSIVFYLGPPNA